MAQFRIVQDFKFAHGGIRVEEYTANQVVEAEDDSRFAEYLRDEGMGVEIVGETSEVSPKAAPIDLEFPTAAALEKMTKRQLVPYGKALGLPLLRDIRRADLIEELLPYCTE